MPYFPKLEDIGFRIIQFTNTRSATGNLRISDISVHTRKIGGYHIFIWHGMGRLAGSGPLCWFYNLAVKSKSMIDKKKYIFRIFFQSEYFTNVSPLVWVMHA